jgi:hypothetical protein
VVSKKVERLAGNKLVFFGALLWMVFGIPRTDPGARLHGFFNPVVQPFTPTLVEAVDDGGMSSTRLGGTIVKLRNRGCVYAGTRWYLHDEDDQSAPVTSTFRDAVGFTSPGEVLREKLIIGIAPERLGWTRGYVMHYCDWLVFDTPVLSLLYEGELLE